MRFEQIRYNLIHKTRKRLQPVVKNHKAASYFTITLSLFSLSFFGMFAIRPTLITAVSLVRELKDLNNLSLDYENQISSIITAQSEYEKIRNSITLLDKALPRGSEFTKFAKTMERLAVKNEITLNQLQIDAAPISIKKNTDSLNNINFILIAIGHYEKINSFLNDVVNSLRIITINSLDFSPEGGTVSGTLRMTMKGRAYYEP
ncbi:hypothetical protein A2153_05230 [Candidatus Gottesmanbacteria bacterium RBG_16_38_7b]|uniref:Pilus assembly protein PilO n=1 Tax=Candidatus Gottesmanbacteria bacterium RBG_16_38_7b TaxID=1798372 RepID=A0A1F5YFT8_9BACT|nr:MAG: hypothetical protein A2153_05230 [Candidatus Gottesmanbacteria bacterium RBG_16_38_7b]